jgi:hypothetical protein
VTVAAAARSLGEGGVAHQPFVPFAACWTEGAQILLADAQERADLGLDAAVDLSSGRRTNEEEVFHDGLHREDSVRFRRSLPSRMKTRQATMTRYHVAHAASMQWKAMLTRRET